MNMKATLALMKLVKLRFKFRTGLNFFRAFFIKILR